LYYERVLCFASNQCAILKVIERNS